MNSLQWESASEANTVRLGKVIADLVPPGTVIALQGTLGAGKTRLVKAMAEALGIPPEDVISPTFVLMQRYVGRKMLYHFDVYRIKDDDEVLDLGPEEYFDSDGITLIEWAERVADCLPLDYLHIAIDVTGETSRVFTLTTVGEQLNHLPGQIADALRRPTE